MRKHEIELITKIYQHTTTHHALVILTPNTRLGIYLHQLWYEHHKTSRNKFLQQPLIITFEQWMKIIWQQTKISNLLLLNKLQEKFFLQEILNTPKKDEIFYINYNEYFFAWELLQKWQVSLNEIPQYPTKEESNFFIENIKKYQDFLLKNQYCNYAQIADILTKHYTDSSTKLLDIMHNLLFIGFDDFNLTPSEKQFIKLLQQRNSQIAYYDPNQQHSTQYQISTPTTHDEIKLMAKWAYDISQQNTQTKIACIVPQLNILREDLMRIFSQIFAQNELTLYQNELPNNIHLSLGKPLASYPIIDIALTCLQINVFDEIQLENIQQILTSPFLANNWQDYELGYKILYKIQNYCSLTPLKKFKYGHIQNILLENHPQLHTIIEQYLNLQKTKERKSMQEWWIIINEFLQNLGWHGERILTDEEQQIITKWNDLQQDLISLDLKSSLSTLKNGFTLHDFLKQLKNLTQTTIFQPSFLSQKQPKNIQINILGMLEANGINFDYIWIMGMEDNVLPMPLHPNIFLPLALQRKHQMPHVDIEQELHFSLTLQQRFHRSANIVIYSYAQQNNESQNTASPLLQEIPIIDTKKLYTIFNIKDLYCDKINLLHEIMYDDCCNGRIDQAPTNEHNTSNNIASNIENNLTTSQNNIIHTEEYDNQNACGGTDLIQTQIDCPFKCFATYRLKARQPRKFSYKIWRGEIVHTAQEFIWKNIKDYATLQTYFATSDYPNKLHKIIQQSIEYAIEHPSIPASKTMKQYAKKFLALEKQYIAILLEKCLTLEFKFRQPFTVKFVEEKFLFNLNDLKLHFVVDRIDQLENGSWIIIDYKTGKTIPSINKSLISSTSQKIETAQLPLYYLAFKHQYTKNSKTNQAEASDEFSISAVLYAHANMQNFYKKEHPEKNTTHNNSAQYYFYGIFGTEQDEIFQNISTKTSHNKHLYDFEIIEQQWVTYFNNIAEDFKQGKATLRTQDNKICRDCHLRSLCRKEFL